MGGTCSRSISGSEKTKEPRELLGEFSGRLLATGFPFNHRDLLQEFCQTLLAKNLSAEECRRIISHFSGLAGADEHYRLITTAMLVTNQSEQIWCLNPQTLIFLAELYEKNSDLLSQLCYKLKSFSVVDKVFLKANHLDTLIASLKRQLQLPSDALDLIDIFLEESEIDYETALQGLRQIHGPELDESAMIYKKIHHAVPHALEIRERTLYFLSAGLKLFAVDTAQNAFLKAIIGFMIEFHDHEQMVCAPFSSVEEVTADRIMQWLTPALKLDANPKLRALLEFIADRVVILGTTMIFSPIRTADLSEVYLMLEDIVVQANLVVAHPSNKELIRLMEATMLVAGVCDKNPASINRVVRLQQEDDDISTLRQLQQCRDEPLLIEHFFKGASFKPYFSVNEHVSASDIQAFFITLAPHLCMRSELFAKDKPALVVKLIDFVAESRTQHARLKYNAFIAWFDQELIKCQMDLVVAELLFAAIDREVSFSLSQRGGLEFIYKRLVERGFIPPNGDEGISLIDSTVPQSDAQNLSAFNEFYKGLNTINQRILIGEVLLAIVMQAGALYAQQLKRGYQKNPVLEEYHLNQVIKDAAGHLLFPTATDIGASRKCKLTAQQEQSNLNPSV